MGIVSATARTNVKVKFSFFIVISSIYICKNRRLWWSRRWLCDNEIL